MARGRARDVLDGVPPAVWLAGGALTVTYGAKQFATGPAHPVLDVALVVAGVSGATAGVLGLRTAHRPASSRSRLTKPRHM